MGMSDLHTSTKEVRPECACVYFRKITSAHVTTKIFYFGDSPASVEKYINVLQMYLYGTV